MQGACRQPLGAWRAVANASTPASNGTRPAVGAALRGRRVVAVGPAAPYALPRASATVRPWRARVAASATGSSGDSGEAEAERVMRDLEEELRQLAAIEAETDATLKLAVRHLLFSGSTSPLSCQCQGWPARVAACAHRPPRILRSERVRSPRLSSPPARQAERAAAFEAAKQAASRALDEGRAVDASALSVSDAVGGALRISEDSTSAPTGEGDGLQVTRKITVELDKASEARQRARLRPQLRQPPAARLLPRRPVLAPRAPARRPTTIGESAEACCVATGGAAC